MSDLKTRIQETVKDAMRARDKDRLGALRLITAEIKQKEVDTRVLLDDAAVIQILDKMLKQRRESIQQFTEAKRDDLVAKEQLEVDVISSFLPEPLSEADATALIQKVVQELGASSIKDMGKVMNVIRPQVAGRIDMTVVSDKVKTYLSTLS